MRALTNLSDDELIVLIKSGDQRAFESIYNRYYVFIYGHILRMINDEDDSKDLVQDVFSKFWIESQRGIEILNLPAYLYKSARNSVLNCFRRNKYKSQHLASLALFVYEACDDMQQHVDMKDLATNINRKIAALPPRMRQVFEMSRYKHLSNKEISNILGLSPETVKKQIHKSLKILRISLKDSSGIIILLFSFFR